MTSPSEAVDTIEKAPVWLHQTEIARLAASFEVGQHPAWVRVEQDGNGVHGGFYTCAAATEASPAYIRADIVAALARKAEAMKREMAEQLKVLDELFDNVQRRTKAGMSWGINGHPTLSPASLHILSVARHRARALIGGDNAQG